MFDKEAFLRLLREDEEFRYAVLGLLGLDRVLDALEKNTRTIAALQRTANRHAKAIRSLQGAVKSLQSVVERQAAAIEAMQKTLDVHARAVMSLQQAVDAHSAAIRELAARVNALGTRWGVMAEEAFRGTVKYLVEDLLGAYRAGKWTHYDSEGVVYGHPSIVEADLLVRDREHILVEFKSSADRADLGELYRLGLLYERTTGVKPRLLLVSPAVKRRAAELARELGIEVRGEVVE